MEWMIAACGAGLNVAAAFWAISKTWSKAAEQKMRAAALLLAALVGFGTGWLLALRVGTYLPNLLRMLLLGAALAAASYTDAAVHRIPNQICLFVAADFALCTLLDFVLSGSDALPMMINGLLSALFFFFVFFLLRLASRGSIGYGDIKFITVSALILGIYGEFSFLLFSHVSAAIVAVFLLIRKKAGRKDRIPFAPFFWFGYCIMLLTGSF